MGLTLVSQCHVNQLNKYFFQFGPFYFHLFSQINEKMLTQSVACLKSPHSPVLANSSTWKTSLYATARLKNSGGLIKTNSLVETFLSLKRLQSCSTRRSWVRSGGKQICCRETSTWWDIQLTLWRMHHGRFASSVHLLQASRRCAWSLTQSTTSK